MPFKKILHDLVTGVPGVRGAILADWEGEAVDHYTLDDDFELKVIGAHKGIILARLREIHEKLPFLEPSVVEIHSREISFLIAAVGPDYGVVVTLASRAHRAQALYRLDSAVELLRKEIY